MGEWVRRHRTALTVALAYAVAATFVMSRWLVDPVGRRLAEAGVDQFFIENMLGQTARSLRTWSNPLYTVRINAPVGVNLVANTAMIALGLLLAPVTWAVGPSASLALIYVVGLAGTALGWYAIARRHLRYGVAASVVGGAFCGFAPTMVGQANGHPSVMFQALAPVIVHLALGLRSSARPVRRGVVLGLTIVLQFFIGQETLLYVALGLFVFVVAAVLNRPTLRHQWRPMAVGLGVAAAIAVVLLAAPIAFEFWGKQSYAGVVSASYPGNDLARLWLHPANSLAGSRPEGVLYAINVPEAGPSFGVLLAIGLAVAIVVFRRDWLARTLWCSAALFVWASLGPTVRIRGAVSGFPALWKPAKSIPLLREIVAARLAGVAMPFVGMLIALVVERGVVAVRRQREATWSPMIGAVAIAAVAATLVPLLPTRLVTVPRTRPPQFLASGDWRRFVGEGRTLVPVPIPDIYHVDVMGWQAAAGMGFNIPGGYFVAPSGPGRFGTWPTSRRPTALLSFAIGYEGKGRDVTPADQAAAAADMCYWGADAAFVRDVEPHREALVAAFTALLGTPMKVDDVTVWDVRALSAPGCSPDLAPVA